MKIVTCLVALIFILGCEREHTGDTVIYTADDGSTINVYVDADGNVTGVAQGEQSDADVVKEAE